VQLNDKEYERIEHQPPVHLLFHINDNTLHGNDGCNTISASYIQEGENFHFSHIKSSKIKCEKGSEQAQEFLRTLSDTNRLLIHENEMLLYNHKQEIARFEAKENY